MLYVHQGAPERGARFFNEHDPEARAVSDGKRELYPAFGLARGSVAQVIGPVTWPGALRAARKGHFLGTAQGDIRLMPGLFLVAGERVLWRHDFDHAGDHPDFASLPGRLPR